MPVVTPTAAEAAAAPAGIVPGAAGGGTNALELAGASKRYAGKIAVDAVDLVAPPGQLVALLGASGSGKSTLLRLINRMAPPSGGTVKVFGRDVAAARGAALRSLRAEIGFIFQRFELVGPLSVWENVLTGASGRLRAPRLGVATYPRGWRQEALSHLERVGLADLARQRADTLSGGQQQRVAVARALMQRPRLVLADEPVASLDPESAAGVMALLANIARRDGLTVVCSLHQVQLALGWADRVVALRDGRKVMDRPAAGLPPAEVMAVYGPELGGEAV